MATVNADGAPTIITPTGPFGERLTGHIAPANSATGTSNDYLGAHRKASETDYLTQPIQMGARVYIPELGRFLQVDPIEGGTLNNYVYAQDPVNQKDLDGKFLPFIAIAALIVRIIPVVVAVVKLAPKVVPKVVQAVKSVYNVAKNAISSAPKIATRSTTTATKPSAVPTPTQIQQPAQVVPSNPQVGIRLQEIKSGLGDGIGYRSSHTYKNLSEPKLPTGGSYRTYDVNQTLNGKADGSRIVIDTISGRSWYTNDHYKTFIEIF
ncbi:MAG: RHS repeat-associated core domain-containing protein [Candidatus Saccharimonas sp.]